MGHQVPAPSYDSIPFDSLNRRSWCGLYDGVWGRRERRVLDKGAIVDATEAAESEEKAAGIFKDALTQTERHMLDGAEVVITSVDEDEVEGTFQFTPRASSSDPELTSGEFRAIIK